MTEAPPPPENKNVRQGDAGAAFVLESKGENSFYFLLTSVILIIIYNLGHKYHALNFLFVCCIVGAWYHAGFHLTTAIVGPTILTLPYAFRGLGWGLGFFCLTVMGVVTFYSYYLMSLVLEHCENDGRRHIRFRELASDVLGMFFYDLCVCVNESFVYRRRDITNLFIGNKLSTLWDIKILIR